ncbi:MULTISPECIES: sodium:proton antiporter [Pseudomonas]|jgi:NhaP-type Na+/H+ or K+/H+ antiporter|uniref:Sodium:proton antiporter n=1 Tax=Pseudomonas monteilii SB3101 TaxID=1435058 RepID=V9UZB7_9PSED|nr:MULTISPECIES: cation:proton antiporter [Pseudomonas]AHC82359.1 sodium:proton antiporter [Pseudomonas monteilii SB3078]AHC87737.1 sodium:proton antiporter [Pseudomonas monteilii SB3101]MDD2008022.1 cation:proton antiporter [Pseudomonas putida]MDS9593387.1 cation:proton antiporter [Pseudomonas sp. HTZ1]QKK96870.1 sodium:proton antiporter [Pseudomonas sp. 13159349]
MTFIVWFAMLGAVLLLLSLSSSYLRWIPVTTSVVCLGLGMALGTSGLGFLQLDLSKSSGWMEHLTEVAVLFSLFFSGLKLRLPLRNRSWLSAFYLAGPVMLLCIGGVTLVLHYGLSLGWGVSVLIGAILAPTDPVLATLVQVVDAQDDDPVRFSLSGEAGLNDGVAFPFVILGLFLQQDTGQAWFSSWLPKDMLWAVTAGLLLGYWMGRGLGKLTLFLRLRNDDSTVSPNDYLALALIALAYVSAETIQAYGFLAVFAAGLGLRQAEVQTSNSPEDPAAEHLVQPVVGHQHVAPEQAVRGDVEGLDDSQVAAGIMLGDMLAFGSLIERAMEVFLVTMLGVVLIEHWDWRALPVAGALFLLMRPLSVFLFPVRGMLNVRQRGLLGWFGIRGIGSFYYLFYALNHGLLPALAAQSISLVLSVVALSILLHGLSVQPLLAKYEAWKG